MKTRTLGQLGFFSPEIGGFVMVKRRMMVAWETVDSQLGRAWVRGCSPTGTPTGSATLNYWQLQ